MIGVESAVTAPSGSDGAAWMGPGPVAATDQIGPAERRYGRRLASVIVLLPLCAGLALWIVSLSKFDLTRLGPSGLPGQAPLTWYVALAAFAGGAIWSIWSVPHRGWLTGLYVAGVALVLAGTIPALTDVPQYAWTYKHIGVIHLIEAQGSLNPSVDIYNRWPGLFALCAALSRLAGVDAVAYAGWVQPVFMGLDALIVAAIARTITRDARVAGMSALLFIAINWVNQAYLSPQTLAYTLELTLMLLVVGQLSTAKPSGFNNRIAGLLGRISRRPQTAESFGAQPTLNRRAVIAAIAVLDAIIVVTHQLTPYMVLLQLGTLLALGITRPRWLLLLLGAITLAYLAPHASYLQSHYGLFSGIDPLGNAATVTPGPNIHRTWLNSHSGLMLSFLAALMAAIGSAALVWTGSARKAIPLVALMLAPGGILLAQSYGGEAALRVYMFSAPWIAILIASGLAVLAPRGGSLLTGVVVVAALALYLPAALGTAATDVIPADEVQASEYAYAHAPAGAAFLLAGQNFPLRVGARYPVMVGGTGEATPDLLRDVPSLADQAPGERDLQLVITNMTSYSAHPYLVFSTSQFAHAAIFQTTLPHSLERLEGYVANSPSFRLWYRTANVRIYTLTPDADPDGPQSRRTRRHGHVRSIHEATRP